MYKFIIIATFVTCFSLLTCICAIEDCGSKVGKMEEIKITGCDDLDVRCILHRGKNVTLTMEFSIDKDVTNVTARVYGVVLGVQIPFALPNSDGCTDSGLTCPLKSGGTYTYISVLPVEKKYPKVTVEVKWELVNENDEIILCTLIPAKLQ